MPNRGSTRIRGQGMSEYIIMVALVAIGTIAAVTLFGDDVRALFGMSADALSGETNVGARTGASSGNDSRTVANFSQGDQAQPMGVAPGGDNGISGGGGPPSGGGGKSGGNDGSSRGDTSAY